MQIKIDINDEYKETTITIHTKEWSGEIEDIVDQLKHKKGKLKKLVGIYEEQSILLNPDEIESIFAENRKVYAVTKDRTIEIKMKLYEVESLLKPYYFTRFSKSVIGNINQIQRFELSFNGNLCVHFKSGNKEYVSKKYVKEIKENLIIGGDAIAD